MIDIEYPGASGIFIMASLPPPQLTAPSSLSNSPPRLSYELCETCKTVLSALEHVYQKLEVQPNEQLPWHKCKDGSMLKASVPLEVTSQEGCPLCRIFVAKLNAFNQKMRGVNPDFQKLGEPETAEYICRRIFQRPVQESLSLIYKVHSSYNQELIRLNTEDRGIGLQDSKHFPLQIMASEDPALKGLNEASLGTSTHSCQTMKRISEWTSICQAEHENCRRRGSSFVPTRLIDVDARGSPKVRIVKSKFIPKKPVSYLTLSHCWGKALPSRLLKENVASMLENVPLDELPLSFRDAITVTRDLGHRYLWIDSLCIIQDDDGDWQRESATMGDIYAGCVLNICATAASDSSQGLFRERDPLPMKYMKLLLPKDGTLRSFTLWNNDYWEDAVEKAPLNQRAWVCQERLLSPRSIHFTPREVFWECRDRVASELFPEVIVSRAENLKASVFSSIMQNIPYFDGRRFNHDSPHIIWARIVDLYTRSKLTHEKDKLVAIGGLAERWNGLYNDQYCAGIWKSHLHRQLLWQAERPRLDHISRDYTAPSWSWASIDGTVDFLHLNRTAWRYCLVDFIDCSVQLLTSNPFGQVKGGSLVLKGRLASARPTETSSDRPYLELPQQILSELSIFWDFARSLDGYGNHLGLFEELWPLHLLPIIASNYETMGLILRKTGNFPGEFRRLGTFQIFYPLVENCREFDSRAVESGLEFYKEANGYNVYTITLI